MPSSICGGANLVNCQLRNVPDVSLLADPFQPGYSTYVGGVAITEGGTSLSAPLWAAFTALVNNGRAAAALRPLGFFSPLIYQIGTNVFSPTFSYADTFHDVTLGSNAPPIDPTHYVASASYDLATGWGSFNGTNGANNNGLYNFLIQATVAPPCAGNPQAISVSSIPQKTDSNDMSYLVSITNNDSVGCGPSEFELTAVLPAGMPYSFHQNTVTVSAGHIASTSLTMSPDPELKHFSFTVKAANTKDPSDAGEAQATYQSVKGATPKN